MRWLVLHGSSCRLCWLVLSLVLAYAVAGAGLCLAVWLVSWLVSACFDFCRGLRWVVLWLALASVFFFRLAVLFVRAEACTGLH